MTRPAGEGPGVNLVQVSINEHKPIFDDLLLAMQAACEELGVPVSRTDNALVSGRVNVLVGASVFAADSLLKAVEGLRFVVYQMEPLSDTTGFFPGNRAYVRLLESAGGVWDYSRGNVAFLEQRGIRNVAWVRPGYQALLEKVPGDVPKSIDVLFIGAQSDRRLRAIAKLEAAGLSVRNAFNLYGDARNRAIAESRIVLNIHQHATVETLEEVRLSFLLANRCFVVSEDADWNPYGDGVVFASYDRLAETCARYIEAGDVARHAIALKGYEAIRATPMKDQLEVAFRMLAEGSLRLSGEALRKS